MVNPRINVRPMTTIGRLSCAQRITQTPAIRQSRNSLARLEWIKLEKQAPNSIVNEKYPATYCVPNAPNQSDLELFRLAANKGRTTIIAVASAPHQDNAARKKFVELSKLNTIRLPKRALKMAPVKIATVKIVTDRSDCIVHGLGSTVFRQESISFRRVP